MNVRPVVLRARRAFEARMRATCVVTRPGGEPVEDDHGNVTTTETEVYRGKCYLRYPGLAFETDRDTAGVQVTESRIVVRVPFGPVFAVGDKVRVLSDPETPHLAGTVLQVASIDDQSQGSAQRLLCRDYQTGVLAAIGGGDGEGGDGDGSGDD